MGGQVGFNDPGAVDLTIGNYRINQFGRGEFLVVKRNADQYGLLVGANGDATRSKMYDRSGKIHVKMLASAPQNAIFHAMTVAEGQVVLGGLPVTVTDFLNKKTYVAEVAWIVRPADDPIGSVDGVEREWVLESHDITEDYAPLIIPGTPTAGGVELVLEIAAQMAARFGA